MEKGQVREAASEAQPAAGARRKRLPLAAWISAALCLAGLDASAQLRRDTPPPADPKDTPAGVLGTQMGDVGAAVLEIREQARRRQVTITTLRHDVERCGSCADAARLRSALAAAEADDRKFLDLSSRIVMTNGGGAATMRFLDRLTDPLNIRGEMREADARDAAERGSVIQLRLKYCYAITANADDERACNARITFQDFQQDGLRVHLRCKDERDPAVCVQQNALGPMMLRTVAERCSLDPARIAMPAFTVMTECPHQGRPGPQQQVTATITPMTEFTGGSGEGLQKALFSTRPVRALPFSERPIVRAWANAKAYQLIACSYSMGSGAEGGRVDFWYGEAPSGIGELAAAIRDAVPEWETVVGRGVTELGSAGIGACPASLAEARSLKRQVQVMDSPVNPSSVLVSRSGWKAGDLLRIVSMHQPRFGSGAADNAAAARLRELAGQIGKRPSVFLLQCEYAPVRVGSNGFQSASSRSEDGFGTATYIYWLDEVPPEWAEVFDILEADENRIDPAAAARLSLPLRSRANAISRAAYTDCPGTLADAMRRQAIHNEPKPYVP